MIGLHDSSGVLIVIKLVKTYKNNGQGYNINVIVWSQIWNSKKKKGTKKALALKNGNNCGNEELIGLMKRKSLMRKVV